MSNTYYAQGEIFEKNEFVVAKEKTKQPKVSRGKLQEELLRTSRDVLKETARLMQDVSALNEAVGDCAANVLDGSFDGVEKKKLKEIADRLKLVTHHIRDEREYIKNQQKKINGLCEKQTC